MIEFIKSDRILKYYLGFFLFAVIFIVLQGPNLDLICSLLLPILDILLIGQYCRISKWQSEGVFITFIFMNALIIRIMGVFVMQNILVTYIGMPFLSYKDDYIYNQAAIEILYRWKASGFGFYDDIAFSHDTYSGFPNFSAALMLWFGTSPLVPRIGNAVLSAFTAVIGYLICRNYASQDRARYIGVLLSLLPLTIIFATLQLKDTLLLFFTSLSLYASVNILQNKKLLLSKLLLVVSLIGMTFGRTASIVPILGGLAFMMIYGSTQNSRNKVLKFIIFIAVIVLLTKGYEYLETVGFVSLNDYFDSRYHSMSTSSVYDTESRVTQFSWAKYLGAPLYFACALFLPPVLLIDVGETINYSAWAMLEHFAFLPFIIPALFMCYTNRKSHPVALYLLVVYLMFKIGQANTVFTSLSPRQSLGTLFIMYLMLPMYRPVKEKWTHAILFMSLFIIGAYNIIRLYSHGMLS